MKGSVTCFGDTLLARCREGREDQMRVLVERMGLMARTIGLAGVQIAVLAGAASSGLAQEATPAQDAEAAAQVAQPAQESRTYTPVTDERLANPEPENWLQWRGNYQGWGYSQLDQITSENVKELVP